MQMRTTVALAVIFVGYGAFLHAARTRGQGPAPEPPAPVLPERPAVRMATPPVGVPSLVMVSLPEIPPEPPALPAAIAIPAVPAVPSLAAVWPAPVAYLGGSRHGDDLLVESCSDLHIRLRDEKPTTVEPEVRTLTKAEAPVLRVHEIRNGGVQVHGWDKDSYSVTACKAAIGSADQAQRLISQIKLSVEGGEVSVSGPSSHEDWTVYLLIRTPKSADIELTTRNGPASFYSVDGKITARATNGPISIADCTGEADISAANGPISFSGTGGKLRLHTENGPISVSLHDTTWSGGGLVADAVNGPLTVRLPSGFHSSFLIESSEHAPISCAASICSDARRTWDDEHRRIELGSGSPVIRLSTQNGPISVM
jgi:hypothetical protein